MAQERPRLNLRIAPLMRPTVITNMLRRAAQRAPMYCATYIDALAPAAMKTDPGYIAAAATFAVPEGIGSRADRAINVCIQACAVCYVEADLPTPDQTLIQLKAGMRSVWAQLPAEVQLAVNPGGAPAWVANAAEAIPDVDLANCLDALAVHGDHRSSTLQIFTTALLAYCKKGDVTNNVMNKVTNAIRDELGLTIHLDQNIVRGVWNAVGSRFTAQNARALFSAWEEAIGDTCLRLRLLVQQTGWTGMTNYQNILKARDMFPTFPWNRLTALIPQDFANFGAAVEAVNGDEYYGYNSNLGPARSTLYPSLSYCAYELLVSVGNERSLRDFQGTNRNTPKASAIERMVRAFEATYNAEQLEENRVNQQVADAFIALNVAAREVQAPILDVDVQQHIGLNLDEGGDNEPEEGDDGDNGGDNI